MKIAYISYISSEQNLIVTLIEGEVPNAAINLVEEGNINSEETVLKLLSEKYDIILMHLSHRGCLALKIAELIRNLKSKTRVVIISETTADPELINRLFDGFINKREGISDAVDIIKKSLQYERDHLLNRVIRKTIVDIINQDEVLREQIRRARKVRHMGKATFADYEYVVEHCNQRSIYPVSTKTKPEIFLSYTKKDKLIAIEIQKLFRRRKIICFMAEETIRPGQIWQDEILNAMQNAREVLLILSENALHSKWVLLEAGAAWALRKKITPCLKSVDITKFPPIISQNQCSKISYKADRITVIDEIAARIKTEN